MAEAPAENGGRSPELRAADTASLCASIEERYPQEPEFLQAARSALRELDALLLEDPRASDEVLLERLLEPDRIIQFRVEWEDDAHRPRVNRGYRVQWNNALGPYKGGLRFHPAVSTSILKFLAFEQTFKNALTGLPLGGAKGGADFDARAASSSEIRRFCQSFMIELHRHVGAERDVPAGDIGVGPREIGFLYGQYKRLRPDAAEALTGKPLELSGSPLRQEATGWGVVYFARSVLERVDRKLEGQRCVVSGSGNVALHAAAKLLECGASVLTLSDRAGHVAAPEGLSREALDLIAQTKGRGGDLSECADGCGLWYGEGPPWATPCDLAFPCATQNEVEREDARKLIEGGCRLVCEGANMPCTESASEELRSAGVIFAPGKAANAGGVAVSEFEMAQAASRQRWARERVDRRLRDVMLEIHEQCVRYGGGNGGDSVDYAAGATRAGFARIAAAMRHF